MSHTRFIHDHFPVEAETREIFAEAVRIIGDLAPLERDRKQFAGLASEVARLKARFVIKDSDASLRGAA